MFNNHYRKPVITRFLGVLLAAILMIGSAFAEGNDTFFAQFDGITWSFCSGAGAWSTDLTILPDGSFSGDYHDSDMGDTSEAYPNGTIYVCSFSGKLSLMEQLDENSWKLHVDELTYSEPNGKEVIEDGVKYIYTDVYGLSLGDEMTLYKPGTPVDSFTDEMKFFAHAFDLTDLPSWYFYSVKNNSGFEGFPLTPDLSAANTDTQDVSMANPWEVMTAEELQKTIGIMFHAPQGADKTAYRWFAAASLAEMQFIMNGEDYTFRAQPVALDVGEMPDISGLYFTWENDEPVTVAGFNGLIRQAKTETGDTVECVLWYDNTTGTMHSLSVLASDVDGLDLAAVAEQIILPAVE